MEKLSTVAEGILNELHTERLDYESEYLPLINAVQLLAEYEDIGTPEDINRVIDHYGRGISLRAYISERVEAVREIETERLWEIAKAEEDGRLIIRKPIDGAMCGSCEHFQPGDGALGICVCQKKLDRYGQVVSDTFYVYQSKRRCKKYVRRRENNSKKETE